MVTWWSYLFSHETVTYPRLEWPRRVRFYILKTYPHSFQAVCFINNPISALKFSFNSLYFTLCISTLSWLYHHFVLMCRLTLHEQSGGRYILQNYYICCPIFILSNLHPKMSPPWGSLKSGFHELIVYQIINYSLHLNLCSGSNSDKCYRSD